MNHGLLLHEDTKQLLDALLVNPPHALLLSGHEGIGKSLLAKQYCASLLGSTSATLPNVKIIGDDTATEASIPIAAVRELFDFVRLRVPGATATQEKAVQRAILIVDADRMTREAQNAMLKLLEEPPDKTVIVLTSAYPRKILPTILSRVQHVRVNVPDDAAIVQHFNALGHSVATVQKAHVLAAGSIARLQQILDEEDSSAITAVDLVKKILAANTFTRLTLVDSELKDKQIARTVVDTLVLVASSSLERSSTDRLSRWQQTLAAATTAQKALAQNGNQKLVMSELMLTI